MHTLARKRGEDTRRSLASIQEQINRLFDLAASHWAGHREEAHFPLVDIAEDRAAVYVEADLPGFGQKDISVTVHDDYLVLAASREEAGDGGARNVIRSERSRGGYYREVYLPANVDPSRVSARYRNGVLSIVLPKREGARGREVAVDIE